MPCRAPSVRFILLCIFLDALGIGLIVPVLPALLGEITGSAESQTLWYGAVMLAYGLVQFLASPVLGALSDRVGRRPVLLGGILGLGCMFSVPAFTDSAALVLASRVAGGMLSANMTVAQAYIADITRGFARAAAFGRIGAAFGAGFVLGPALGGLVGDWDVRLPFWIASAVCCANFLYGLLVLPESLPPEKRRAAASRPAQISPFSALAGLFRLPGVPAFAAVLLLTGLANGLVQCTWALYAGSRYGFTPLSVGASIFALGIALALVQGWLLPRMLRRLADRRTVLAALWGSGLSLAGIGLSDSGWLSAALCCTYAVGACTGPVLASRISALAPAGRQGETMGAVSSINSLTGALSPLLGTPLLLVAAQGQSPAAAGAPYFLGALCIAAALGAALAARWADASRG